MSKIITDLVGKICKMKTIDGNVEMECTVTEVDEEWVKYIATDKKYTRKTKIVRIEMIEYIELIGE